MSDTIAFLGAGNMAAAMVDGLLRPDPARAAFLRCLGGTGPSAAALARRTGIQLAPDLPALLAGADVLVVAFKPRHLAQIDPRAATLTAGRLVISVLAGKTLGQLAAAFPAARNLVRTMPNTPGRIGAGISGWSAARPLPAADRARLLGLLGALGQEVEIPEENMDALTAVSGSGPAYLFEFAAALRDAGISAGLPPAVARQLSVATLAGAGRLLESSPLDPEALRRQVTSPHGVTQAGLDVLERAQFRTLVAQTVRAAQARAGELSREA